MNSEGCTEKPPGNMIQACAPLMDVPSGDSTAIKPRIDNT